MKANDFFKRKICKTCNSYPCCCIGNLGNENFSLIPVDYYWVPRGATGDTGPIGVPGPAFTEGFSAFKSGAAVTGSTRIENWSPANPYFTTPNFNPTTGLFTVPETGRYCFEEIIKYSTNEPLKKP